MATAQIINEWAGLIALVFVIGVIVCRLLVLPQDQFPDKLGLSCFCMAVLFAAALADLIMRSLDMSGQSIDEIYSVLPTVLSRTHYGHVWLVRICFLVLLTLTSLAGSLRLNSRKLAGLMLIFVLGYSMTQSASGHAADAGDLSIPEIMDWLHLIAASVWGGGLLLLSVIIPPRLIAAYRRKEVLIAGVAQRFSTVAGVCVAAILVTSAYNWWQFVHSPEAMLKTPYGLAAEMKMVLLVFLLILGAFNRYINVPLLQQCSGLESSSSVIGGLIKRVFPGFQQEADGQRIALRFMKAVRVEAVLIICVLLCASYLRHGVPARHAIHLAPGAGSTSHKMHEMHQ